MFMGGIMITLPVEPGFIGEAPNVTAIECMASENVKGHFHGPIAEHPVAVQTLERDF
jgi:hypothetical protein